MGTVSVGRIGIRDFSPREQFRLHCVVDIAQLKHDASIYDGVGKSTPLSRNTLNHLLQLPHIPTNNPLLQRLTILIQHKRRHRPDIHLLRHRAHLIDIDLDKSHIGVLLAKLSHLRRYRPARTAPRGEEIDDDRAGRGKRFVDDGTE